MTIKINDLFFRQLMSLNLLPAEKISKQFYVIVEEVSKMHDGALLKTFCNYVERQWIKHSLWPPTTWSMFMELRRTNNNADYTITL